MPRKKGGKRGAHPSYRVIAMGKSKNKALHRRGKQTGKHFSKSGPQPVGIGKRARFY